MTKTAVQGHPHHSIPQRESPRPGPLAAPIASFIGRERELDLIDRLLGQAEVRLVTLTGPGGVGKTRLAIEAGRHQVATRFPERWLVTLAAYTSPADVIPAIAHTVGVREFGDRPLVQVLATALRDRRSLIILDNAEHVLAAASALADLLAVAPGLKLLVTSREPLRLSGEHELRLDPLPAADPALDTAPFTSLAAESSAVRLFASRAVSAQAEFALTDANYRDVRRLCHLLDGLPLAIELAAARVAMLSPAALLTRLEQRGRGPLPYLTDGARDLPDRQRTLRDTIRWSYDLLTPAEQSAFHALSAFECSFSLDHAEALIETATRRDGAAPSPFSLAAALVTKSLVVSAPAANPPRLNLLATIRDFGRERLDERADTASLRLLHAELVRDQTAAWNAALAGPDYAAVLAHFTTELGNITTALEYASRSGSDELLLALAGNLSDLWRLRGLHGDGWYWLSLALARDPTGHSAARIRALIGAGNLGLMRCDYAVGIEHFDAALAAAEAAAETRLSAWAMFHLAKAQDAAGNHSLAESLIDQADAIVAGGDPRLAVEIAMSRGEFAARHGDVDAAHCALERGLAVSREIGFRWAEADLQMAHAAVARDQGDACRACDRLLAALAVFVEVDDPVGIANVGTALAWLAPARGEPAAGLRLYAASSRQYETLGLREPRHKYPAHEAWLTALRASLGAAADREWAAGWAMSRPELGRELSRLAARFTPARARNGGTAGLSQREAEVLDLLAGGLSNAAIAERLYLSPRTINAHLTRIYGKLNVPNRHAAIRYAIDHGLARDAATAPAGSIK